MSNIPISSLPLAISLAGNELVPIVQGGTTKQTTTTSIAKLSATGPGSTAAFVMAINQSILFPGSRLLSAQAGVTTITDGGAASNITVGVASNGIGNTQLRQGTGLSIIGNAGATTANEADIVGTAGQILRVNNSGTALGFAPGDSSEPVTQVTGATATIAALTPAVAVVRSAPTSTALTLPSVASQNGVAIHIFDWSSAVTGHTITLTPNGSDTIMLAASFQVFSNSSQLGGVTLYPSTTLSGWYIAP